MLKSIKIQNFKNFIKKMIPKICFIVFAVFYFGNICESCTPTQTYIPRGEPGVNGSNVTIPLTGRRKRSTEVRIFMEFNSQNMKEIEEIIGNLLEDSEIKVWKGLI